MQRSAARSAGTGSLGTLAPADSVADFDPDNAGDGEVVAFSGNEAGGLEALGDLFNESCGGCCFLGLDANGFPALVDPDKHLKCSRLLWLGDVLQ